MLQSYFSYCWNAEPILAVMLACFENLSIPFKWKNLLARGLLKHIMVRNCFLNKRKKHVAKLFCVYLVWRNWSWHLKVKDCTMLVLIAGCFHCGVWLLICFCCQFKNTLTLQQVSNQKLCKWQHWVMNVCQPVTMSWDRFIIHITYINDRYSRLDPIVWLKCSSIIVIVLIGLFNVF